MNPGTEPRGTINNYMQITIENKSDRFGGFGRAQAVRVSGVISPPARFH